MVLVLVVFVCIGAVRLNEGVSQPERTMLEKGAKFDGKEVRETVLVRNTLQPESGVKRWGNCDRERASVTQTIGAPGRRQKQTH